MLSGDDDAGLVLDDASTASLASSILEYRTIQGHTFHSERFNNAQYFTPNDSRQADSVDITHHCLTILLGGKLYLAPIKDDVQKVVDIGTGTGIWAIDFADEHPSAEVIGTDISPMQPSWVPPNVKFEIDDATQQWTWRDNTFDFVHIRYLNGALKDWNALFREAYRTIKPGAYVESAEFDPRFYCGDGTATGQEKATGDTWSDVFEHSGKELGLNFTVVQDNTQETGVRAAGFEDVHVVTYKCPVGSWAADPTLNEVGKYVQLTLENDMEGYTLFLWTSVLKWSKEDHQLFLSNLRKLIRNRRVHNYLKIRVVYGRKPSAPATT